MSCNGAGSSLAVGGVISCTGVYTVTAADINSGVPIVNVASARSAQVTTPVTDSVSVNVFSFPQFTAVKSASVSSVSAAGTQITYSVTIRFERRRRRRRKKKEKKRGSFYLFIFCKEILELCH